MEAHEASGKNGGGATGEFAVEGASEKEGLRVMPISSKAAPKDRSLRHAKLSTVLETLGQHTYRPNTFTQPPMRGVGIHPWVPEH